MNNPHTDAQNQFLDGLSHQRRSFIPTGTGFCRSTDQTASNNVANGASNNRHDVFSQDQLEKGLGFDHTPGRSGGGRCLPSLPALAKCQVWTDRGVDQTRFSEFGSENMANNFTITPSTVVDMEPLNDVHRFPIEFHAHIVLGYKLVTIGLNHQPGFKAERRAATLVNGHFTETCVFLAS